MDEILTMTPDVGGVFTNLVYDGFPENIKGINLYASRNDVCIYHVLTNKVDEEEYINKFSLVNQYFFYVRKYNLIIVMNRRISHWIVAHQSYLHFYKGIFHHSIE